jgi:hypothetical protein
LTKNGCWEISTSFVKTFDFSTIPWALPRRELVLSARSTLNRIAAFARIPASCRPLCAARLFVRHDARDHGGLLVKWQPRAANTGRPGWRREWRVSVTLNVATGSKWISQMLSPARRRGSPPNAPFTGTFSACTGRLAPLGRRNGNMSAGATAPAERGLRTVARCCRG